MNAYRGFSALGLALACAFGISCTSSSNPLFVDGDADEPEAGGLLACEPLPYAATTAVIGAKGGHVAVGAHVLRIPVGALSEEVTITAEQVEGPVNSVRFGPEGLQFDRPAELTLSYKNCVNLRFSKRLAYTDELLQILESLPSADLSSSRKVSGPINHFSRYAVAF